MKRHSTLLAIITFTLLLAGCGGTRKLFQGKYHAAEGAMPGAAVEVTASQIILTLKDVPPMTYNYKVVSESGNKLTLEVTGGTLLEKTNLDVLVEKDGISFVVQSYFSAVLQGKWLRN